MTKTDRAALSSEGIMILRPGINKKSKWQVMVYSSNGGWCKYQDYDWFPCYEECELFIDALARNCSQVIKDE